MLDFILCVVNIKKTYITISRPGEGKYLSLTLNEQRRQFVARLIGLRWFFLLFPLIVVMCAVLSQLHQKHMLVERIQNQSTLQALSSQMDSLSQVIHTIKQRDDFVRKVIGYDLISEDIFQAGVGGPIDPEYQMKLLYNPQLKVEEDIKSDLNAFTRRLDILEESRYMVKDGLLKKLKSISQTPSILPAEGRLVSGYGVRVHPIYKVRKHHKGIDITNKTNTDIISAANGQVIRAQYSSSYGNFVEVKHNDSITTLYAHLKSMNVQVGDKVFRGQVIGKMGNTGRSTGTHLHYEVRKNGNALNPKNFFLPENKVYD